MAAAAVQPSIILLPTSSEPQVASVDAASDPKPHHVHTVLNYYKDPGDGSPAPPTYTDRPQTGFARVIDVPVTIRDVRGHEAEYTLDKDGFQFRSHVATEKDFLDDGQIKARYYPEVEQLLKDV